jgi:hypothetical protein
MPVSQKSFGRRFVLEGAAAVFATVLIASPLTAGALDASPVRKLLGGASDSAFFCPAQKAKWRRNSWVSAINWG